VETGSREENALNKGVEPSFRSIGTEEALKRQSGFQGRLTLTTSENARHRAII
jgi:hypothetical protein